VTVAALAGCGSGPNSLGVIAYDPTGLAFRHMMEGDKSLNIALGLGGFDSKIAHGHVDYIMHFDRIAQDDWNPYWGIGVGYLTKVDSNDDSIDDNEIGIALRVPLGISYQTDEWDFFAQLAGYVGRRLGISAALGVRFNL
jgi:hypothetical protein